MEMVKYFALLAVMALSLVAVDVASARGRRGCSTCGGCPGGVCYAPAVPVKAAGGAPTAGPVVAEAAPAPVYATTARRGLFGFRR
jgi:hypothetical protein